MHDLKQIRDDPQAFDAGLKRRGLPLLTVHAGERTALSSAGGSAVFRNSSTRYTALFR